MSKISRHIFILGCGTCIQARSEVIATYALCGFANIGDVGICLGAIGAIVPSRKGTHFGYEAKTMMSFNFKNQYCFLKREFSEICHENVYIDILVHAFLSFYRRFGPCSSKSNGCWKLGVFHHRLSSRYMISNS